MIDMTMKAVTFNLRMNTLYDGANYFFNRSPYILAKIKKEAPDIIGFQEATRDIHAWLLSNLTEYTIVGIGRDADFGGEANPIAFRKDRFELFGMQQFWLSPTPEVPGSRYEHQSRCPRVLVSVKLKETATGKVLRFYNTHLDHIDAEARLLGIGQILKQIEEDYTRSPHPVILTGDMNADPTESSMRAVTEHCTPVLHDAAKDVLHSFHGYHGGSPYEGSGESKIDYIFTNLENKSSDVTVWTDENNGLFLSDHYPIMATLIF